KESLHQGITRRGFLKTAAVAGAAAAAVSGVALASTGTKAAAESTEFHATVPHLVHCGGGCTLDCTVRDGHLVNITPLKAYDERLRKMCLRAVGEISNTYSKDRVMYPMKRAEGAERGESKFERISWDEAIDYFTGEIKKVQDKYGKGSVFLKKTIEASNSQGFSYIPAYIGCQTEALSGIDRNIANGMIPAFMEPHGLAKDSVWAWNQTKTLINIAHNQAETAIPWYESVALAQEAGCKFIVIDPRFSPTAGKADQWISVVPGQDPALFLGVLNAMVFNGWYDEAHCKQWTSMPDLVNVETGELLGEMEPFMHPIAGKEVQARIPMMWDTVSGMAVPYNTEGAQPALEGTFDVDGVKAKTQFTLLKQQIAEYTPGWAAAKCGVSGDVIEGLADQYANHGPSVINWGMGGADKFTNGDILGHTLAIMAAITGNYGKRGAGIGAYPGGGSKNGGMKAAGLGAWPMTGAIGAAPHPVPFFDMPQKANDVHAAIFFGDVPFLQRGNSNQTAEWLKSLDFVGVVEIYMSTVCAYADIILPSTSRFECSEDWKALRTQFGYVALQQKAIEPLWEAKDDLEIERLILAKWGADQYLPKTYEELTKKQLAGISANAKACTWEYLTTNNGYFHIPTAVDPLVTGPLTPKLATHTGRAEVYYENLISFGQAFPRFEEPSEAYAGNPLAAKYPLTFLTGKTRFRNHSYMSNTPWFHQMYDEPLMMNPQDVAARGLKDGDTVRVFNDRGEFTAMLWADETIRPGSVYMAEERFLQYSPGGLMQSVTNSLPIARSYTGVHGAQVPFNDNLVQVEKA
ncbi:MAG: molybdopterin-dependent oxidoreductase, partial [Eggerthellaceae bacterium]|nr:molybdopterin-dependent oxidoreductase [Eggerthellaceae bacterium]